MNIKSFSNNYSLLDIYYISNTPYFFYKKMREIQAVQELSEFTTQELIAEFTERASAVMKTDQELVDSYALFIALTFKPENEVKDFFKSSLDKIKFEWFPDIAKYYLTQDLPTFTMQTINIAAVESSEVEVEGDFSFSNQE